MLGNNVFRRQVNVTTLPMLGKYAGIFSNAWKKQGSVLVEVPTIGKNSV